MNTYQEKFEQRRIVGEKAEKHFQDMCKQNNVFFKCFGIEKANYDRHDQYYLDYRLQCQPDYIMYYENEINFIEVKSTTKFKEYDLESYKHWNVFNKLIFFISYNNNKEYILISFDDLYKMIENKKQQYYPDNNKIYYEFTLEQLKKQST